MIGLIINRRSGWDFDSMLIFVLLNKKDDEKSNSSKHYPELNELLEKCINCFNSLLYYTLVPTVYMCCMVLASLYYALNVARINSHKENAFIRIRKLAPIAFDFI
ncbi:hypothetical protein ACH5RR_033943 [Cinchona calisaya]|uniref:Uncharacterized protein n=1 Tax=Cinchona calisaya TaxID=153742 RepID=A0ABD2Y9G2_9GENT